MRSRSTRLVFAGFSSRIGCDCPGPKLAHTPGCGNDRHAVELGRRTTSRRANLAKRYAQQACGRDRPYTVGRHDGDHFSLTRAQIRHQVGSPRETVQKLQSIERVDASGRLSKRGIKLHPDPRAKPCELPPFAIAPTAMVNREPKCPEQMMLVGDSARRHHDGRDRVVDDFLLRDNRNAAALAAVSQLPDQLRAAPMQLARCLLWRPVAEPMPPDHALYPRPPS
jgi:hypothetical protein